MASAGTEVKVSANLTLDIVHSPAKQIQLASPVQQRFELILTAVEVVLDFVTVVIAIHLAYWVTSHGMRFSNRHLSEVSVIALAFAGLCVLMLDREGAYRSSNSLLRVRETERILRVCAQNYFLGAALILFTNWHLTFRSLNWATAIVAVLLLSERYAVFVSVRGLHLRGRGLRRVVIFGAGDAGKKVYSAFARSPKLGLEPVAIFDDNPRFKGAQVFHAAYRHSRGLPVTVETLNCQKLQELGADMLVLAVPTVPRKTFSDLLSAAEEAGITFAFVPQHHLPADMWTEHADIDGVLLASVGHPPRRLVYEFAKRAFEFVVAFIGLLLLFPFGVLVSILIRVDSPGKAIFTQERVGKEGRIFRLYKFRTMHIAACGSQRSPRSPDDARITKIGRLLRRTSLDELPQLLNVLIGNMSLVGPRPEMPFLVDGHEELHRQRLHVKPGITGLWQISADRAFHIHENIEYDLYYIRHRNFFMDLAILLHTMLFAVRGV